MFEILNISKKIHNTCMHIYRVKKLISLEFKLAAFHHLIAPTMLEYPMIGTKHVK